MKYSVDIIKSDRKTISISVRPDGKVTVHAPIFMKLKEIESFIESKQSWINKTLEKCRGTEENIVPFSSEELKKLSNDALKYFSKKVDYYANLLGVTYGKITVKKQKTRWGSCSSTGNLNFNYLLMLTPEKIRDSVIAHELCHRKEMNHSKKFYEELLRIYPDYYECDKWLKKNGIELMKRLYVS